ncbi:lasso peptide biosynthesis B2 protein [Luteimonas sp. A611]
MDIGKDRYFRLQPELEQAFIASLSQRQCSRAEMERLIKAGLLVITPAISSHASSLAISPPTQSVLEMHAPPAPRSLFVNLEVPAIVLWTKLQLKMIGLKQTLQTLAANRQPEPPMSAGSIDDQALEVFDAARIFRRARKYVPLETRCLLDSIALVKFLAVRGLHADIVFGVTTDPFAAHCWAQFSQTLLNDTIGNVSTYTPILVI